MTKSRTDSHSHSSLPDEQLKPSDSQQKQRRRKPRNQADSGSKSSSVSSKICPLSESGNSKVFAVVDEEHLSQEEDQPSVEQFSFGIPDDLPQQEQRQKPIIELRDLSENDFLDLIDSKNQDKRFYSWLHF